MPRPGDPLRTAREVGVLLGLRTKELRLGRAWKRSTLAARSGVSESSLKRFENQGKVSLDSLLRIAEALGRLEEFQAVLLPPPARTIDDLEEKARRLPKRGRR